MAAEVLERLLYRSYPFSATWHYNALSGHCPATCHCGDDQVVQPYVLLSPSMIICKVVFGRMIIGLPWQPIKWKFYSKKYALDPASFYQSTFVEIDHMRNVGLFP